MSALDAVWSYPSFRNAVRAVLELDEAQLAKLRDLTRRGFELEPEEVAEQLGISLVGAGSVLLVCSSIFSMAREEDLSGSEVASKLVARAQSDDQFADLAGLESRQEGLAALFAEDEQIQRSIIKRSAEGAYFPELRSIQLGVDLRVLREPNSDGQDAMHQRLVPVVVARMVFDEPVGATDRIAFQLPPAMLSDIGQQLSDVETRLSQIANSLQDWLY